MIELKIIFDPATGQAQVTGPLHTPFLCLAMLATAEGIVKQHGLKAEQTTKIIPANGHALASLGR